LVGDLRREGASERDGVCAEYLIESPHGDRWVEGIGLYLRCPSLPRTGGGGQTAPELNDAFRERLNRFHEGPAMTIPPTVFVVDPDETTQDSLRNLAGIMNLHCETYAVGQEFLDAYDPSRSGCVILEIKVPGINGLQIQQILTKRRATLPLIFLCNQTSVAIAVHAMRSGAFQFFEKPCREDDLWCAVQEAIQLDEQRRQTRRRDEEVEKGLARLTEKERLVLGMIAEGKTKIAIAADLGVSVRTVEYYRAQLLKKLRMSTQAGLLGLLIGAKASGAVTNIPWLADKSPATACGIAVGRVATR
jgi:FixJ family two-component response regulator